MRLLVFLFAIITATYSVVYSGNQCYKGTRTKDQDSLVATEGYEGLCYIYRKNNESFNYASFPSICHQNEFKYTAFQLDCFSPFENALCCRGDYCNYMKSLNCSDVYVPKKCPTGAKRIFENKDEQFEYRFSKQGLAEIVRLRGCPVHAKFCELEQLSENHRIYGCKNTDSPCDGKTGCWKVKDRGITKCCKPIEEEEGLSMSWGDEMMRQEEEKLISSSVKPNHDGEKDAKSSDDEGFKTEETTTEEEPSGEETLPEEPPSEELSTEKPSSDEDYDYDLTNLHQTIYIYSALLVVMMIIF